MKEQKDIFNYFNKKDSDNPDASYFEHMANNIIEKETKKKTVTPLYKKPSFWIIAAAASLAFIFSFKSSNISRRQFSSCLK